MIEDDEPRREGPGFRCSICSIDWPLIEFYRVCPSCLEPTDKCSNIEPLSQQEALSEKSKLDFERFYEEWDGSMPPDRLDPLGLPDYKPSK